MAPGQTKANGSSSRSFPGATESRSREIEEPDQGREGALSRWDVITLGANRRQKGSNVQLDLVTFIGFGVVAVAAIVLRRHFRGDAVVEEDGRLVGQRRDVLRAIKSMRKD